MTEPAVKAAKKAAKKAPAKRAPRKAAAKRAPRRPPVPRDPPPIEDDPALPVWQAREEGMTWAQAARAGGYPSTKTAQAAVERMLEEWRAERSSNQRQETLALSLARKERLLRYWLPRAEGRVQLMKLDKDGQPVPESDAVQQAAAATAVEKAMRLLEQIDKIEGNGSDLSVDVTTTIVISGSEEEYIAGLQRVVAQDAIAGAVPRVVNEDGTPVGTEE